MRACGGGGLRVAGELELDRVVVVEVVQAEYGMALVEQAPREVKADKAGRAGDEEGGHRRKAEERFRIISSS